jgi:hypothetical protein
VCSDTFVQEILAGASKSVLLPTAMNAEQSRDKRPASAAAPEVVMVRAAGRVAMR